MEPIETCEDCSLNYYPCEGERRIKELESAILDLQSELARKKYSLSVACNRVEELEGKLKIAVDALEFYGNHESWIDRDIAGGIWHRASPKQHGDSETIRDYEHPNTDWVGTVVVGGKKAREALEQLGELK